MLSNLALLIVSQIIGLSSEQICTNSTCKFNFDCSEDSGNANQCGNHFVACGSNVIECIVTCGPNGCRNSTIISAASNTRVICNNQASCYKSNIYTGINFGDYIEHSLLTKISNIFGNDWINFVTRTSTNNEQLSKVVCSFTGLFISIDASLKNACFI